MSDLDLPALPGPSGVRAWRRYLPQLGATILARLSLGESLSEVCRDPEMPSRGTVKAWARDHPAFGERLRAARLEGGHLIRGRKAAWCPHVARLILRRLAGGMSLAKICAQEGMPAQGTVYRWVHEREDFARGFGQARMLLAHFKFDEVWETAEAAKPGEASLARVKTDVLRWQAARLAPGSYGTKAGEGAPARRKADEEPTPTVYLRHFGPTEEESYDYLAPCQPVGAVINREPEEPWEL